MDEPEPVRQAEHDRRPERERDAGGQDSTPVRRRRERRQEEGSREESVAELREKARRDGDAEPHVGQRVAGPLHAEHRIERRRRGGHGGQAVGQLLVHVPVERPHQEKRERGHEREAPAPEDPDGAEVEEQVGEAEREIPAHDQRRGTHAQHAHPGPRQPVVERRLPRQVSGLERLAQERLARVVDRHHGGQGEAQPHVSPHVETDQHQEPAQARPRRLGTRRRRRHTGHGDILARVRALPSGPRHRGTD